MDAKRIERIAAVIVAANNGRPWPNEETHIKKVSEGQLDDAVKAFVANLNERHKSHWESFGRSLVVNKGLSYYKLVLEGIDSKTPGRSVYCFISKVNGDILLPASWQAPAKHARGNVFERSSWSSCSTCSPGYLK